MHHYFKKLFLILFIGSSSVTFWYESVNATDEASEVREAVKRAGKRRSTQSSSEEESDKESEEKPKKETEEPTKKARVDEEEEDEKEEEATGTPQVTPAQTSKDIGVWIGDKDRGIEALQLKYKDTLISGDLVKWHLEAGEQISKIIGKMEESTTNYIKARIDFIYNVDGQYKVTGAEIPAIFVSNYTTKSGKADIEAMTNLTSEITTDPYIPISSYYKWDEVKDFYKDMQEELLPLFEKLRSCNTINPVSEKLLKEKEDSLNSSKPELQQYWLHSEEPLIYFLLNKKLQPVKDVQLETFREILSKVQLPEGVNPEVSIISVVSKNDCCTYCRPLILEAIYQKRYIEEQILLGLKRVETKNLKKVLLYSALKGFQIKRPEDKYISEVELTLYEENPLFLMAGNKPKVDVSTGSTSS